MIIIWNNDCFVANNIIFNKSFYCLMYINALSIKNLTNPLNYLGINRIYLYLYNLIHRNEFCSL